MTASHILAVYNLASVADKAQGTAWYATANQIAAGLAEAYGVPHATAAGVIAALSPRNKWERNVADAEALIKTYQADPASAAAVKVCTFGANKAKALQILEEAPESEERVLAILSGPKLQEFFGCIVGHQGEVCIDGHAFSIWAGDRITLANVPAIGAKLRREIKADYREAAREAGIPAYEMQAITWCAWRRLHGVG